MKVGDMIEVYYIADDGQNVDLGRGIVVNVGSDDNPGLITVLTSDGEIKEFSRNFPAMQFDVINELSDEQLEVVRGGMDSSSYAIWRSSLLNERG